MGNLCSRSGVQVPVRPAAENVVGAARKASSSAQQAATDACGIAEEAQRKASEAMERLKDSLHTNEESAVHKVEEATDQASKLLESQPDKIVMLSEADQQLLAEAKKKLASGELQQTPAAAAGAGGGGDSAPESSPPPSSAMAYLFYAPELEGGSLLQWWMAKPVEEEIQKKKFILLASFTPAAHKRIPKTRLTQNNGVTVFLQEIAYRWDIWGKAQRQAYFKGWTKFLKAADDMEATVKVFSFSKPAPAASVFILHTAPTGNKVIQLKEGGEGIPISLFGFAAAAPPNAAFKDGANVSSKRFGEIATEAGGSYIQLSRRAGDAALDQEEVVKWLAADGLQVSQGGGIKLGEGDTYERRSEKKGGGPPASLSPAPET
ncbi:hypothetical protein Efla_000426 [Eimeria flavescens]